VGRGLVVVVAPGRQGLQQDAVLDVGNVVLADGDGHAVVHGGAAGVLELCAQSLEQLGVGLVLEHEVQEALVGRHVLEDKRLHALDP